MVRRRREQHAEAELRDLLQVWNLANEHRGIVIQFHEVNGRGKDSAQAGGRNVSRIFHYISIRNISLLKDDDAGITLEFSSDDEDEDGFTSTSPTMSSLGASSISSVNDHS